MEDKRVKVYVCVNADHKVDGTCLPRTIMFPENGKSYDIDRIRSTCRAASRRVGGTGIRYTVVIRNQETVLFDEENGKWFVEMKSCAQPG